MAPPRDVPKQHRLTLLDAAKLVGVAKNTVRNWAGTGQLASVRENETTYVDARELLQIKVFSRKSLFAREALRTAGFGEEDLARAIADGVVQFGGKHHPLFSHEDTLRLVDWKKAGCRAAESSSFTSTHMHNLAENVAAVADVSPQAQSCASDDTPDAAGDSRLNGAVVPVDSPRCESVAWECILDYLVRHKDPSQLPACVFGSRRRPEFIAPADVFEYRYGLPVRDDTAHGRTAIRRSAGWTALDGSLVRAAEDLAFDVCEDIHYCGVEAEKYAVANAQYRSLKGVWMQTAERRRAEQAAILGGFDKLPVAAYCERRSCAEVLARFRLEEQALSDLPDWFWDHEYSPNTGNDWLSILRVILSEAIERYELAHDPMRKVANFDTRAHRTYTREQPNSLTVHEVPAFLAKMGELFPDFFAFAALGFATGLRPSTLRPLRRKGPSMDVLHEDGILLIRRSHTETRMPIELTKTAKDQELSLPAELMSLLKWHGDRLPSGPKHDSDLLFPAGDGGLLNRACLRKPFAGVCEALGLNKKITPRGMRRTFQDLARAAELHDFVTRAVSGHATEAMQHRYSTVSGAEMQQGLAKVISLAGVKQALEAAQSAGDRGVRRGVHRGVHGDKCKKAG